MQKKLSEKENVESYLKNYSTTTSESYKLLHQYNFTKNDELKKLLLIIKILYDVRVPRIVNRRKDACYKFLDGKIDILKELLPRIVVKFDDKYIGQYSHQVMTGEFKQTKEIDLSNFTY